MNRRNYDVNKSDQRRQRRQRRKQAGKEAGRGIRAIMAIKKAKALKQKIRKIEEDKDTVEGIVRKRKTEFPKKRLALTALGVFLLRRRGRE